MPRSWKRRVDSLKNFGIADEETIIGPGINGKMSEFQAAYGLLQLDMVEEEIANRSNISTIYRSKLRGIPGISFPEDTPQTIPNYAYFPILVDETHYGMNRDDLHALLKRFNIHTRKYFHPLCSHFSCYSALPSASPGNLPVAERVARQVLCLPLYGGLEETAAQTVCTLLKELRGAPV